MLAGLFRETQSKLLITGWWSLMSWIIAPFLLIANVGRMWSHASSVETPAPSDSETEKVLRGRPVFMRPGPIILLVAIAVLIAWSVTSSSNASGSHGSGVSSAPTTHALTSGTLPPTNPGWVEGACVTYLPGDYVETVWCDSSRAEGRILSIVSSSSSCPSSTRATVPVDSRSVDCLSEW